MSISASQSEPSMLKGSVVLVTGGGRGIGRSHCLELARHGARVVVNDPGVARNGDARVDDESQVSAAESVVNEIRALGSDAVAHHGSVTSWTDAQDMIKTAVDTFGRLDGVVNNAGILRDALITRTTESDWDAVLAVHLKGTFNVTKHASDYWRAQSKAGEQIDAHIVNTTSGTGLRGNAGQAAYGAAKAAIANFTLTTALEMRRYGVSANAISPVAVTRMSAELFTGDAAVDPKLDPGRSSGTVAWLMSAQSSWLTGQVLRIEGDTLIRMRGWSEQEDRYVSPSGILNPDDVDEGVRLLWDVEPAGLTRKLNR